MVVIRSTLLTNLIKVNAHNTVIIEYYLAFNSDWLFACYFVIILSLVATAVCYTSMLARVTRRLISLLIKVKACHARVRVTSTFSTSESTTRPHHGDEIPERDVMYHLTCLLIYH